jgi:hypothetical protein
MKAAWIAVLAGGIACVFVVWPGGSSVVQQVGGKAQPPDEIGRYEIVRFDMQVVVKGCGMLCDTSTGECWLRSDDVYFDPKWVPLPCERPWKDAKPSVGRFRFKDEMMLDTVSGKTWWVRIYPPSNKKNYSDSDLRSAISKGIIGATWEEIPKVLPKQ